MARWVWVATVAAVVLVLACAPVAAAPRIFTVAGGPGQSGDLRLGGPATSGALSPASVVGLPAGGFAFLDIDEIRVLKVDRAGRLGVLAGNGRFDPGDGRPASCRGAR